MTNDSKQIILRELQTIPGIGKSISEDLWQLGLRSVRQLKDKDPEKLYRKSCERQGAPIDRCLLYVYRCAVYYASHNRHAPQLLLWWNWSDENMKRKNRRG